MWFSGWKLSMLHHRYQWVTWASAQHQYNEFLFFLPSLPSLFLASSLSPADKHGSLCCSCALWAAVGGLSNVFIHGLVSRWTRTDYPYSGSRTSSVWWPHCVRGQECRPCRSTFFSLVSCFDHSLFRRSHNRVHHSIDLAAAWQPHTLTRA